MTRPTKVVLVPIPHEQAANTQVTLQKSVFYRMARSSTRDSGAEILHEAIERVVADVNAFEIAICLFTGGIILLGSLISHEATSKSYFDIQ